ncbi:MAG: tat (twin-arginine translocation) pathway signal sequence [Spirochaetae bacterium HGW-Spirochaetae-3]|jgi:uncharacterized protein (DUF362 family)|nr:MAG: tat (twin-arginine translocation) pathway signal sequence [Spirochaetae bacterium HGW-Spirochaetae-3]
MDRREFFRTMTHYGLGAAWLLWGGRDTFAQEARTRAPDLVAVKGGGPDALFDAGIAALGGMKAFVHRGQTVVVKPNIGWDQPPETAANTNPSLVKRIVEHCLDAGARKVYVFDNSCDSWSLCYKSSMIERYAKEAGAEVVPANASGYFQEVSFPGARTLKKARVHELVIESDVFINVPVLKHHSGAGMTASMKNLMGVVWDRQFFHRNDLHQCIADACLYRKPDLNVIDAYRIMKTGGPRGYQSSSYDDAEFQILSADIVAADAAAARTMGFEPSRFGYIVKAAAAGSGQADISRLDVRRISL